jgi:hypothetical protein
MMWTSALACSCCSLLSSTVKRSLSASAVRSSLFALIATPSTAVLSHRLCPSLSGPSMNAGGATPDAPAQCSLADVGGLLLCAIEDGQLCELQGPPHSAPGPHIEAVVYPPPRYTPVRVNLHSRHTPQPAATIPESVVITLPPSGDPIPRILTPSRSTPTQSSLAFAAFRYKDGVVYPPHPTVIIA